MSQMTVSSLAPPAKVWTYEDLFEMPEDGNRYEVHEGQLLVTPPPEVEHGWATDELQYALRVAARPLGFAVRQNIALKDGAARGLIPDITVDRPRGERGMGLGLIALVVEVLSPSNGRCILDLKRHAYARSGIPQLWLVDPDAPRLAVLKREGDTMAIHAALGPKRVLEVTEPFPFTLPVASLITTGTLERGLLRAALGDDLAAFDRQQA